MGKCDYLVRPNLRCGVNTGGLFCKIHEADVITDVLKDELKQYIEESSRLHGDVLYLDGKNFKGINWGEFLGKYCGEVFFSGCKFDGCRFSEITFNSPAHFVRAQFADTSFEVVAFYSGADFAAARFDANSVPFSHCTFKTDEWGGEDRPIEIRFLRAVFPGIVMPFPACSMSGNRLSFKDANLASDAFRIRIHSSGNDEYIEQYLSISCQEIDLTNISFNGHFDYSQVPAAANFAPRINFERVNFATMASATLVEANLEKASFRYSVLEKVGFFGCKWPRRGDTAKSISTENRGRKILCEDIESQAKTNEGDKVTADELVRLYVQLKRNWEDNRDFMGAGDWFYREMECRRIAAKQNQKWIVISSLLYRATCVAYKKLSRYGESCFIPLIWLIAAYVGFSIWYLLVGIPLECSGRELNYDWFSGGEFKWADVSQALKFGFQAMMLKLPNSVNLTEWDGAYIYVLQFVWTATLIPLFLLALRRKFRR